MTRLGRLVLLLAAILAVGACGATPPRPSSDGPAPSGAPSTDAAGSPIPDAPTDVRLPLVAEAASVMWGLYVNDRVQITAGDHAAWLQAAMPCADLLSMLAAGEWRVERQVAVPMEVPGQETSSEVHWLLLSRDGETVFGQLGGDAASCGGRLTRSSIQVVEASGVHAWQGDVTATQLSCMAARGMAQATLLYADDTDRRAMLMVSAPLEVGVHELGIDDGAGVSIGRSDFTLRSYLDQMEQAIASGNGDDMSDASVGDGFGPGEAFEGEIEVTSVDPLVGEVRLRGLTDERGRDQAFTAGVRCDLPPGRLTAAAEQASPAGPSPTPSAAPGSLSLTIDGGPYAGMHEGAGGEILCSQGLFADGRWFVAWSPDGEPGPDDLAGLILTLDLPEAGGRTEAPDLVLTMGSAGDLDGFMTIGGGIGGGRVGSATATVARNGDGATIELTGTTDRDTTVMLRIECGRVERP